MKFPYFKRITGAGIILLSGILSWLIANIGVDTGNMEIAAIANLFFPPIAAILSIILFLFIDWALPTKRFGIAAVLFILNLLCGIIIRIKNVE